MIQGSAVSLVQLKASDSSENFSNKFFQVIIFCMEQNKLRKNYIAMS